MRSGSSFPLTRCSVVQATGSDDPRLRDEAWDALLRSYWKPVYKYIRIRWSRTEHDAADLTQEFFARAIDRGFFAGYDPTRARFRTYLRVCLDRFLSNEHKAEQRLKRGGAAEHVALDFADAEAELASTASARAGMADTVDAGTHANLDAGTHANLDAGTHAHPDAGADAFFRRESIRSLFALAIDRVRADAERDGRSAAFRAFEAYDLSPADAEPPTYRSVADALGLPVTTVTNHLFAMRRRVRAAVLDELRAVSGSDGEFRDEARELFGYDPG